jgi:hypothetical protein
LSSPLLLKLRHVHEEVLKEGVQVAEDVRLFPVPVVPMISLAPLVVVADKGYSLFAIIEAVLVTMSAAGQRFRQFPYDKLQDAAVIAGQLAVQHSLSTSLHWGIIHPITCNVNNVEGEKLDNSISLIQP